MPLTNSQYNSIMRSYEEKQRKTRYLLEERTKLIYSEIPAYERLDRQVSSISIEKGKQMLNGNSNALSELKNELKMLSEQKAALLSEHGYPDNYLMPIYECSKCSDTGYVGNHKCSCFRAAEIELIYEQSHIKSFFMVQ